MTKEEKIEKLKKLIHRIVNGDNKMEGKYGMPYSTSNDDYADWKVDFKVDNIKLWETERYVKCKYSGSVYLKINVMVGFKGDWDRVKIWDLPGWIKDDIDIKILDNIQNFLPMVCVDITFD